MSERSPNHTGEETVWQGTPSQAVNLPVYLMLGLGVIAATVGLLYVRPAPSATTDVNTRALFPWIILRDLGTGQASPRSRRFSRSAPRSMC